MWDGAAGAWGALLALCAGRQHQRLLPPLLPNKLYLVSQGRCWEGLSKGEEVKNGERLSRKPSHEAFKTQLSHHLPVRNGLAGLALPRVRVIAEC